MVLEEEQSKEPKYPRSPELRHAVKDLERDGENNMYSIYKKQRKSRKERNSNLAEQHLSEELANMPNVSIEKYSKLSYKRGL